MSQWDMIENIFGRAINVSTFGVFGGLLVLSLLVAGIILGLLILTRAAQRATWSRLFVLLLSLGLLGAVAGYAGGISREGAVGEIIPAVLGVAGGLAAYLFGIDVSRGAIASIALSAFTTALFFGYSFGADVRGTNDRNLAIREACLSLFFDPRTYLEQEVLDRARGDQDQRYRACAAYWQ